MIAWLLVVVAAVSGGDRITMRTGVRTRQAPDPKAAVVDTVPLGTVLPCLEESAPVVIDATTTGTFCRTHTKKGDGWFFAPLTEPVDADRAQQMARMTKHYVDELVHTQKKQWPDVYEVHDALLERMKAEQDPAARLDAAIDEAVLVRNNAAAFIKDARIGADDSQGPRMKNDVFEKLLQEAAQLGGPVHEHAAWALYKHGMGGECEDDPVCLAVRLDRTACRYLAAFPTSGAHAEAAREDVKSTLARIRAQPRPKDAAFAKELDDAMARLGPCETR